ncbi:CLUMA_CG005455, isoform A [Clunio marinus]|uniref:CLUMA_CG005455, isoform A n=1 Tax=Clunio marinus TaxID=568069 RepID=A0A1J1I0B9_9DIPT|nr:CLUMA_CG005455, isoform A [Clunio marinus]
MEQPTNSSRILKNGFKNSLLKRKHESISEYILQQKDSNKIFVVEQPERIENQSIQYTGSFYSDKILNETDPLNDLDDLISYSPEPNNFELEETSQNKISTQEISLESNSTQNFFLQQENCFETSQILPQCIECKEDPNASKYNCRFYEFRKIQRTNGDDLKVAGFLDPHCDPKDEDVNLWTKSYYKVDKDSSDYILSFIASQFCEISETELKVKKSQQQVAWKRSVLQVREICDVCETSLFNLHWSCTNCGTCVCFDCSTERSAGFARWKPKTRVDKTTRDNFYWYKCHNNANHNMLLTQMITNDALTILNDTLHKQCEERSITQNCGCSLRIKNCLKMESKKLLLGQPRTDSYHNVLRQVMKCQRHKSIKMNPSRRLSLMDQKRLNQCVKFTYLVQNRVIKFLEPSESEEMYKLFQNHWERGVPIVVANITKNMNKIIWSPEYFSSRFGDEKHVMINCSNGVAINRVAMKYFWDGFESVKKRLPKENDEEKLVLKLKDWPTSDDFADVMKEHFDDLMKALPLKAYTKRNGKFNLVRYLPDFFSLPDLGPKMYSAYSQSHPSKQGSTNLHLDVSDAINVMVHVSKPFDWHLAPNQYSAEAINKALDAAGADKVDKYFHLNNVKLPGAIWHIYPAHQADEIRKILNAVAIERGKPLGVNDDPIHDQNWYIDVELRQRFKENDIEEYMIVQYEGDAVFIPAGAPHQVLNVLDCIKVALDFVAPENISECLNLTEEFRILSTRHQNREDKLQIKNILYHTIKNLIWDKSDL